MREVVKRKLIADTQTTNIHHFLKDFVMFEENKNKDFVFLVFYYTCREVFI
ncbi:MAG: hypothetical protein RMJ37_03630 [Spirochaetia bacterium]|nr:hypothetical protein [Spirochaetota bacterium]MCX8096940.1 hypothetical protein [Spirochaetota bacterium]MDW8112419.1 hypothetical protein [Spirochaetia bacterium]